MGSIFQVTFAFDDDLSDTIYVSESLKSKTLNGSLEQIFTPHNIDFVYKNGVYLVYPIQKYRTGSRGGKTFFVEGFIYDNKNNEKLPYASIYIPSLNKGTISNTDGYFSMREIPDSIFSLTIQYLGYRKATINISPVQLNKLMEVRLEPVPQLLKDIKIISQKKYFDTSGEPGLISINFRRISALPSFVQSDVNHSIQWLPGISAIQETSSGLAIRGGDPDQNKLLFEGFSLYNDDHFFGYSSTMNSNIIKNINVYKSGYGPEFGGAVSGLIEVIGKTGDFEKKQFAVDANLLGVGFYAEIPVHKKLALIFAGRRSYTDHIQSFFFKKLFDHNFSEISDSAFLIGGRFWTVKPEQDPTFYFYDVNAKATYKISKKQEVRFAFYKSDDHLTFENENNNLVSGTNQNQKRRWGNDGLSLVWDANWRQNWYAQATFAYSKYESNFSYLIQNQSYPDLGGFFEKENNRIEELGIRLDNRIAINTGNNIELGLQYSNYSVDYSDKIELVDLAELYNHGSSEFITYIKHNIHLNKVTLKYGLRTSYFSSMNKLFIEPRLSLKHWVRRNLYVKLAAGKYNQFVKRSFNDNLFYDSKYYWVLADNDNFSGINSVHFITGGGVEFPSFTVDVEFYYKKLDGLSKFRITNLTEDLNYIKENITGNGKINGLDLSVKYGLGDYTGWLSYSYLHSNYLFPGSTDDYYTSYLFPTHELKLFHMYNYHNWDVSLIWISGFNRNYPVPNEEFIDISDPDNVRVVDNWSGNFEKVPNYHRMDVGLNYTVQLPKVKMKFGAFVYNALNKRNIRKKVYKLIESSGTPGAEPVLPVYKSYEVRMLERTPNFFFRIEF